MADQEANSVASGRFGLRELIKEAERESFIRRRVYPNQVRLGRMSQEDADRRIDIMEAIITRLRRILDAE